MRINATYTGDIVPRTTKWIYCATSLFRDAAYALVSGFLLVYITYTGLLGPSESDYVAQYSFISVFVVLARIWDGFNDPIMGWIVEKFHLKMGKYKPWILMGGIGNTLVILGMFLIRPTGWNFVAFFCIFYFLWDFVFTINDIGYWSMLPSLTSDEKQRSQITTIMSIFVSIGAFAVYGIVPIAVQGGEAATSYGIIAIVVAICFLVSQIVLVVFAKEKEIDPEQEKKSEQTKIFDMFKMLKTNSQLRWSTLAILLYYIASSIVIGFGLNYFYMTFGYGSDKGGAVQTLFTVFYAVGTLVAQFLFPLLSKNFKMKTLFTASFIAIIVGYAFLFLVGFPLFSDSAIALSHTYLLYIGAFVIFSGQGIFYLILLIYMQNSIEYNEWKFGERKEAAAFSLRPLNAKLGSALQQLILLLTFLASGLLSVANTISDFEANLPDVNEQSVIDAISGIDATQLTILGIGMVVVPMILIVAAYILINSLYTIDEEKYKQMVKEIKERKVVVEDTLTPTQPL